MSKAHPSEGDISKRPSRADNTPVVILDSGEELSPFRWIILVGLITAAILEVLDSTIVNVALPQMAGNLGATSEEISWVATSYILSNVIVLPMTAWLSSHFGRKRYLVGSIMIFIVGSFFCGTSHSLNEIIFWRLVQGAGGAALISTAQATLREIFPREQQGVVQSLYVLGVIMAPTIGPTLGGWITDNYTWSWIFFVNIPIGIFSATIVMTFLNDSKFRMSTQKIDWAGVALLASGLGSLQYVLEEGNQDYWFQDPLIVKLTILSLVSLSVLVFWELSKKNTHPIVNLRVMRNADLSAALTLFLFLGFGLYGGTFIFPLFTQNILGFTPTETGLALMPGAIATGVMAIICGRLLNGKKEVVNPLVLILTGMTLFIYSMWDLGHMTPQTSERSVYLTLILRGAGLGMLFTPINLAAFNSLRGTEIAQGASMLNLMRQMGGSFGIAGISTYITTRTAMHYSDLITYIYPQNPAFIQRMTILSSGLIAKGYPPNLARIGALQLIENSIQAQAMTMSFNDSFLLIGLLVLCVSPLAFRLRKSTYGEAMKTREMAH